MSALGENDMVESARELSAADREYLAAIRAAPAAAAENFQCFGRQINTVYGDTSSLLAALAECDAGEAIAKIEAAVLAVEPPARFADEHAWLVASLADRVAFDERIGAAVEAGDVVGFLANNARLDLASRPDPALGLDREFIQAAVGAGAGGSRIDPAEALTRTVYGRELHAVMAAYDVQNPFVVLINSIDFPQVPREEALGAITDLGPEILAVDAALSATVEGLVPPPELEADHGVVTGFVADYTGGIEQLIEAAAAGDVDTITAVQNTFEDVYCEANAQLSDAIRAAVEPFFESDPVICR